MSSPAVTSPLMKLALWTGWSLVVLGALVIIPVARDYHRWHTAAKCGTAFSVESRYVNESFPRWQMAHPYQERPLFICELATYTDGDTGVDPWGDSYVVRDAPVGIVAISAGPDHTFYTADDVRSDEDRYESGP